MTRNVFRPSPAIAIKPPVALPLMRFSVAANCSIADHNATRHDKVWEWVQACFNPNFSGAPTDGFRLMQDL